MDIYTARVMAALRFPPPADRYDDLGNPIDYDEMVYAAQRDQEEYAKRLLHEHAVQAEGWEHQMNAVVIEEYADQLPPYPNLLLDELDSISAQIRQLEELRDQLLVFARLFALEPLAARKLAERVGLSYSTILRNASDEDVTYVQAIAQREAAALVHSKDAPQGGISNPGDLEAYQRLRVLAGPTPAGEGQS